MFLRTYRPSLLLRRRPFAGGAGAVPGLPRPSGEATVWTANGPAAAGGRRHSIGGGSSNGSSSSSPSVPTWAGLVRDRHGDAGGSHPPEDRPSWSEEWRMLGLGAELVEYSDVLGSRCHNAAAAAGTTVPPPPSLLPPHLYFVQLGFGVDQHGDRNDATKAAVRAVRNAIEFNSIPGVVRHVPGGRREMLIHVKLAIPNYYSLDGESDGDGVTGDDVGVTVDVLEVAKVFPYGKLLPPQVVRGGLEFHSGRVVEELGDSDDVGICVVACVSIGHDGGGTGGNNNNNGGRKKGDDDDGGGAGAGHRPFHHETFSTKDGY